MICASPWHGLYSGQAALLTPDSFAHPAKMAPALVFRIFDHLAELGLLKPDDTVLDPMAGTGLTGLAWAAKGGRSVLVELEPRFVGFIGENKAQLARTLGREVDIEVLQGDARHLSELLGERGLKAVTSPPYGDAVNSGKPGIDYAKAGRPDRLQESEARHNPMSTGEWAYGSTPGQIGALKDKPLKAVTSPPYGMGTGTGHGGELDRPILTDRKVYQDYNKANPSNIGNLPDKPLVDVSQIKEIAEVCRESFQLSIASIAENHAAGRAARQPVGDVISLSGQELTTANSAATRKVNTAHNAGNLSSTERQYARVAPPGSALWADLLALSIENACANLTKECQGRNIPRQAVLKCLWLSLKDENLKNLLIAAFTELLSGQSGDRQYSPEMPIHAESVATKVQQGITSILSRIISNLLLASLNSSLMSGMESRCAVPATTKQRETEDSGTSYLSAMKVVYEQIARVADVLVVVTKNPTRNGKLRRLDLDTIALLEETGWTLHCHHRAILFTEVEQYEMMRWMHDTPAPKPSPEVTEFLSLLEDDEEAEAKRQSRQDVLDYFAEYDQWEKTGYWGPGGIVKRTMGRLSFFKRLSWQKGNAVARWEDVLVCVRGSQ